MINLSKIEEIKGFMPNHEGEALMSWAKTFSKIGPLLEIGSFCGKSSIYLGLAAKEKNQVVLGEIDKYEARCRKCFQI